MIRVPKRFNCLTFLLGVAVAMPGSQARADTYIQPLMLDPAASTLGFHAHTTFHDFDAVISHLTGSLSLTNGKPDSGEVKCLVTEIATYEKDRDVRMQSAEFLDAAKFPAITFRFESLDGPPVPVGSEASGTIHGSLRVKDRSVAIAVPVKYEMKGGRAEIKGGFALDIRKFGLEPPVVFVVQRMDATLQVAFTLRFVPMILEGARK